jgi:hypothetical protein
LSTLAVIKSLVSPLYLHPLTSRLEDEIFNEFLTPILWAIYPAALR